MVAVNQEVYTFYCLNVGDSEGVHVFGYTYNMITTSHRLQVNVQERMRLNDYVKQACDENTFRGPVVFRRKNFP